MIASNNPDEQEKRIKHLRLATALAICGVFANFGDCSRAQIAPDSTQGAEGSVVTNNVDIKGVSSDRIDGGAIRGATLFHSFREFNIDEGRGAYFTNPAGIENILSRVTGGNPSNIFGALGVLGNANLFLINPNGIIFGPSSSLDVGGSFVATTASSLNFADGTNFSAQPNQTTPLLRVSVPIGLQFGGTAGSIVNQSRAANSSADFGGLQVQPGKTLALVGGDVSLDSGYLDAQGGRVELGGLAGAGSVGLNVDGNNLRLDFPDGVPRADVSLTNGAYVDVAALIGGSIALNARNIDILANSSLLAGIESGKSSPGTQAGDITLNATGAITVTGITGVTPTRPNGIRNNVSRDATGNSGNIIIKTGSLSLTDNARLSASTFGQGNAGNISVQATGSFALSNGSTVASGVWTEAVGNGGVIDIKAGSLSLTDGAQLVTSSLAQEGSAGNVSVQANDLVSLTGQDTTISSTVEFAAVGNSGNINIKAGSLSLSDGAQIQTVIGAGVEGNAGNVSIDVRDTVTLAGVNSISRTSSAILSTLELGAVGKGGNISIKSKSLSLTDGAQLATTTLGQGDAGSVMLTARDTVSLEGVGSNGFSTAVLTSVGLEAVGNAGGINITTGLLSVTDQALLSTSSVGSGAAGNIEVAADSIRLDNQASLNAETTAGQGNIILRSQDLVLRRGSNITTNATGSTVIGGSITIDTDVLAALENSDISANSLNFRGGQVRINAQSVFGTQFQNVLTPESDITATGGSPELSGTVEINTLDNDPSQGLTSLPAELVETSRLIASSCATARENNFTITGRGGLPPSPSEVLGSDTVLVDWGKPIQGGENGASAAIPNNPISSEPTQIVEAQGWVIGANGEVILTARPPIVTPHSPWMTTASCHTPGTSS